MSATIYPFTRDQSGNGNGCSARGTAPGSIAPAPGATPDLAALAAGIAEDLKTGSVFDAIADVVERAADERRALAHRPAGIIADAAMDGLATVILELDVVINRLAARAALAEAEELDRRLLGLPLDQALEVWRELTKAQQSAVIWVQSEAMTPGGAA